MYANRLTRCYLGASLGPTPAQLAKRASVPTAAATAVLKAVPKLFDTK